MLPDNKLFNLLLIEDNPADIELTREALIQAKTRINLTVCHDGQEALDYLYGEVGSSEMSRPDLILLDLNMPGMDGHEFMKEISKDEELRIIPLVVLTTSDDEHDIKQSYSDYANCYITKPVDFEKFVFIIKSIESFWLTVVKLP